MGCFICKRSDETKRKSTGTPKPSVQNEGIVVDDKEEKRESEIKQKSGSVTEIERKNSRPVKRLVNGEQGAAGWPSWLCAVAGEALDGWIPRRAGSFQKIDKIGQGTYSNVYKARDLQTGKIVALKKVRFDSLEKESVKFMAREILVLRRLDHPNVIKLEGLVTSRMSSSLYLIFEYMEHDLAGLAACPNVQFSEAQIKCYMKQLLCGLDHCHTRGVLHRDIKGSNLLIDNEGILKIADFGLAFFYYPDHKQTMTSRVVTLWYRAPELLLGSTSYGVGIDLWSAGCILAELLSGKPILPGRTEVEQLHKIFKLCGSPPEEYWKKHKLPHTTIFKPQQPYKRCIAETFKDFPPHSLALVETLLALDPTERGTAASALQSDFFIREPLPCEPSSLPQYPPSKEIDAKLRDEESRRQRVSHGKEHGEDNTKKLHLRDRVSRAIPAPMANAELQVNLDRRRFFAPGNAKSRSEKFPPPHQDAIVGYQLDSSQNGPVSFGDNDTSFSSSIFELDKGSGASIDNASNGSTFVKKKYGKKGSKLSPSQAFIQSFIPSSFSFSMEFQKSKNTGKGKQSVSENLGGPTKK